MIPISENIKDQDEKTAEQVETEGVESEKDVSAAAEEKNDDCSESEKEEQKKKSRKELKKEKIEADKLAEKDKEIALLNDKYLRLCAEYDNFRKRSQKEKDSRYNDAKEDAIIKMLPVYDNLERALAQKTEDEAYYKGVEMIMSQFNAALEKLGVAEVPALGEKFDPSIHNAVMHIDDEEKGENEIVDVFQKGFKLGDKVIRFAMVKVAN